jgi:hypothetical protein
MHTIDLLKGQGIPAKTTLGSAVFVAVIAVIPIVVAAVMMGSYLLNNVKIEMGQGYITKSKAVISELQPEVRKTRVLENERDLLIKRLTEVSRCIDTFVQWSPILITVSEEMPAEMIMGRLETTSSGGRAAKRRDNDPNKPAVIPIPKRTINLDIRGIQQGSFYTTVQDFQNSLQLSAAFVPRFKAQSFSMNTSTGNNPIESYFMKFESQTQ